MEKRVTEGREEDDSISIDDRISQLPQPILQHILHFLSQTDAVKTCLLSKSWHSLWCTRPKIEFRQGSFGGNKENLTRALDKTLQRYLDQNLSVQEFILEMWNVNVVEVNDDESYLFLKKWIPVVILDMGVRTFNLVFLKSSLSFDLPPFIFNSVSLEELYLEKCNLSQIDMVLSKNLRTLSLTRVHIPDEIFEKLVSSCPLIGFLAFHRCNGLNTIKVNNNLHNFKGFEFSSGRNYDCCSIEIDSPTVETININSGNISFHHHLQLSNLSIIKLCKLRLSSDSFSFFSHNCPNLEDLAIIDCDGFKELCLLRGSLKYLNLSLCRYRILEVVEIDAPNIVKFEYEGVIPKSFSFTTSNSDEWKSYVTLLSHVYYDYTVGTYAVLPFFSVKLYEVLKELSQSEISLDLAGYVWEGQWSKDQSLALALPGSPPVAVEHLELGRIGDSYSDSAFIDELFCVCRPRIIGRYWRVSEWDKKPKLSHFQRYILKMEVREIKRCFWQHDLEEVIMEAFDENGQNWNVFCDRGLSKNALRKRVFGSKIRLLLKWRPHS